MSGYRVKVARARTPELERPWFARLVPPGGEPEDGMPVGRFDTMPEAVTRGVTALRFVAAGIPWHADDEQVTR